MSIFFESGILNISSRYKRSYRQTSRLNTKWASQIFFPFISHINNLLLILHSWLTVFNNSWSASLPSESIICLLLWPIILMHLTICSLVLLFRPKTTEVESNTSLPDHTPALHFDSLSPGTHHLSSVNLIPIFPTILISVSAELAYFPWPFFILMVHTKCKFTPWHLVYMLISVAYFLLGLRTNTVSQFATGCSTRPRNVWTQNEHFVDT